MMFRLMAGERVDGEGAVAPRWGIKCDVRWCARGQRFDAGPRADVIASATARGWSIFGAGWWCICDVCASSMRAGGACEAEPSRAFDRNTRLIGSPGASALYPPPLVAPHQRRPAAHRAMSEPVILTMSGRRLVVTPYGVGR